MPKRILALCAIAAVGLAASNLSLAQQAAPTVAPPPGPVSKDPSTVPAGVYALDVNHSSIIARIPHSGGVSVSTMRFGVAKATLNWDPANPAAIKLEATVDTKPHYDPIVYRNTPDSPLFLNAAKFPQATFTSTKVTRTGPNRADVTGDLMLLGVTRPVVMHIEMVGASKNNQGVPIVGFTGSMQVKRSDFGNNILLNNVGNEITLQLDGEFLKS